MFVASSLPCTIFSSLGRRLLGLPGRGRRASGPPHLSSALETDALTCAARVSSLSALRAPASAPGESHTGTETLRKNRPAYVRCSLSITTPDPICKRNLGDSFFRPQCSQDGGHRRWAEKRSSPRAGSRPTKVESDCAVFVSIEVVAYLDQHLRQLSPQVPPIRPRARPFHQSLRPPKKNSALRRARTAVHIIARSPGADFKACHITRFESRTRRPPSGDDHGVAATSSDFPHLFQGLRCSAGSAGGALFCVPVVVVYPWQAHQRPRRATWTASPRVAGQRGRRERHRRRLFRRRSGRRAACRRMRLGGLARAAGRGRAPPRRPSVCRDGAAPPRCRTV